MTSFTDAAADAWHTVAGSNGRRVRTNSYDDHPDGARFAAVLPADGDTPLLHLLAEQWADPATGEATMARLWHTAADGHTEWSDSYDVEIVFALADGGAVRCCPAGSYVRITDPDGEEFDDGSAYWIADEWRAEPELVMGAILGAATSAGR